MKKIIGMMAVLAMATTANANLLSGTWQTYEAGWGSGTTFSNMSASSVSIQGDGSNVAYQIVDVTPGETYTLSGTVAGSGNNHWTEVLLFNYTGQNLAAGDGIDGGPGLDNNIQLKTDGFGGNPGVYPGPTAFDVNIWGYWNNPSPSLDIVPTGTQIVVGLKAGASGGSNTANFTDVALVPEPTSLILLGLGGLAFLRRRR